MNALFDCMENGWDFAYAYSQFIKINGSTVIPEAVINGLGGHPSGNGTYRLDPIGTNQFGFEIFGTFTKAPEKYSQVGTIGVTKGGFKITEPLNGKNISYADFDIRDEQHKYFHFHPNADEIKWYFETDFQKISDFILPKCSNNFRNKLSESKDESAC